MNLTFGCRESRAWISLGTIRSARSSNAKATLFTSSEMREETRGIPFFFPRALLRLQRKLHSEPARRTHDFACENIWAFNINVKKKECVIIDTIGIVSSNLIPLSTLVARRRREKERETRSRRDCAAAENYERVIVISTGDESRDRDA